MTDTKRLKCAMLMAGLTIAKMAEALGLSYYGFYKKLVNKSSFKSNEIAKAIDVLKIDSSQVNEIFFADNVANMDTNKTTA